MQVDIKSTLSIPPDHPPRERDQLIVQTLLNAREVEKIDEFLHPPRIEQIYQALQDQFTAELSEAKEVITQAIENNQSIVIHGDYDVDGVCATAILWETMYYDLKHTKVLPFIPHRVDHGYGVSRESIDQITRELADKGWDPGVLITVDCGITAQSALEYAQEKGFTIIVTDHHTKPTTSDELPQVRVILHTHDLSGAGIAWLLAKTLNSTNLQQGVDLVALATLADIQPVIGFNRSLIKEGLGQLTATKRAGLQALYQVARIAGKPIGVYEVGWVIGPRLNATGRLDHAMDALRLLVVRNQDQAIELASKLDRLNQERQDMTQLAIDQALQMVDAYWDRQTPIIVAHQDWHEGIIGLIAGRLTERFKVPAIAIAVNDQSAKGSARSVKGINIIELLREYEHLLGGVGGHAEAAGFQITLESLPQFNEQIASIQLHDRYDISQTSGIQVDLELDLDWINWELYQLLAQFEPHGIGNPRPIFVSQAVSIIDYRLVGAQQQHLQMTFSNGLRGIGFGLGDKTSAIEFGQPVDVVYTIDKDDYRGNNQVQLKVKQILRNEI